MRRGLLQYVKLGKSIMEHKKAKKKGGAEKLKLREELLKEAPFDILDKMNRNMRNPAAGINVCVFNCFGNHTAEDRKNRCAEYCGNCSNCIAAMLDEAI